MQKRRYEFRVKGILSEHARNAFHGMDVTTAPAETVISGEMTTTSFETFRR